MQFLIDERKIECENEWLIGDNADYTAQFAFDAEWDGLTKTARFQMNKRYVDVILEDDACKIPVEILKQGIVEVGVYTDTFATTPCEIKVKASIKQGSGNVAEPNEDVYGQLIKKLDALGANSVSDERVAEAVSTYMSTDTTLVKTSELPTHINDYLVKNGVSGKNTKLLDLEFVQYGMYGNGTLATTANTSKASTQMFTDKGLYLVCFPDELKATYNVVKYEDSTSRRNLTAIAPFSMYNDGLVRVCFERKDGTELLVTDEILNDVQIYKVSSTRSDYDIVIAGADTNEYKKDKADIVLDGVNDTRILCAITGCYHSIKALLYGGTYNITEMWTHSTTAKIALSFNNYNYEGGGATRRYICIEGDIPCTPQAENTVKLYVSKELHESLVDSDMYYFVLGAPYSIGDTISRNATSCKLSNMNIIGYKYDKPITYVDTTRCLSTMIESVNVRSWAENITSYNAFEDTPHAECTGIRVGRGSNYGIQCYLKHSNVWYCGKGVACNGEHYIFEDVKTHHDYIGWVFGDRKTVGHMEHPNMLIGCSIEGCYRLMWLTRNGQTEEADFVADATNNICRATLVAEGTSAETTWAIPTNETNGGTTQKTLPILETIKGMYRGRFEIDYPTKPFEEGSCINMKYTAYHGGDAIEG